MGHRRAGIGSTLPGIRQLALSVWIGSGARSCRQDRPARGDVLASRETTQDASIAMLKILESVAKGELTPSEASEISRVIENYAETVRLSDLEQRIAEMEQRG